jgi:hypothetical protein
MILLVIIIAAAIVFVVASLVSIVIREYMRAPGGDDNTPDKWGMA